ncbi:MAG: class I SAM-dependent methyltransferase [Planctomycetota bacterium]
MTRLARNLIRMPTRALRSLNRRRSPAYSLQKSADREIQIAIPQGRLEQLARVPGTSSTRECRLLAHLAMTAPKGGCIVEIGAFKGKSTAWIVEGATLRDQVMPVVSIDPHQRDTWNSFCDTVLRFQLERRGLEVRRAMSHVVGAQWNRPISLLWIDGSHEYEDVVHDIEDFVPHVVAGGWVVFDDAAGEPFPGVSKAIAERMALRPGFESFGLLKHFAIFRRTG